MRFHLEQANLKKCGPGLYVAKEVLGAQYVAPRTKVTSDPHKAQLFLEALGAPFDVTGYDADQQTALFDRLHAVVKAMDAASPATSRDRVAARWSSRGCVLRVSVVGG